MWKIHAVMCSRCKTRKYKYKSDINNNFVNNLFNDNFTPINQDY